MIKAGDADGSRSWGSDCSLPNDRVSARRNNVLCKRLTYLPPVMGETVFLGGQDTAEEAERQRVDQHVIHGDVVSLSVAFNAKSRQSEGDMQVTGDFRGTGLLICTRDMMQADAIMRALEMRLLY